MGLPANVTVWPGVTGFGVAVNVAAWPNPKEDRPKTVVSKNTPTSRSSRISSLLSNQSFDPKFRSTDVDDYLITPTAVLRNRVVKVSSATECTPRMQRGVAFFE